ncbi:MAG: Carbamoyl-phosphate synthase large chain [Chlamydiae bacterium]|nr:Carbamoyl-phosphate synthase large chain [Chlamydiota bacterium]
MKKVLILGSGGLRIGQAGEFDYSGSQAIKALKEEGIKTVLINPNIATVQTDPSMADKVYLQPLNLEVTTKIIEQEKPDAILLGFGGQTALNLGLELFDQGVLKRHKVKVLGSPIEAIRKSEDRELFKNVLKEINIKTPKSVTCTSVEHALSAAEKIGYPIMVRAGYSLGGLGAGKITSASALKKKALETFQSSPQILVEEYLIGWKEIEYEIVRDQAGNSIAVCNMENFDPMGVHTGESIVVAPSQTLNDTEYQFLRTTALKIVQHLGIIGECNVQYAFNPKNGDYRVIEVNARLSRSSALASKATGYPLAFVAAKISLGFQLHEIKNSVTEQTSAFFEPALDYLVVKIPRWDTTKLKSASRSIGSEMKSVGEVMAIGRSFCEALQKAIRMLNIGANGISNYPDEIDDLEGEIHQPTDRRLFAIYQWFLQGHSAQEAHKISHIDLWFLNHLEKLSQFEKQLKKESLTTENLRRAKQLGFSDKTLAWFFDKNEKAIRSERKKHKILPYIKQIDTLAGEFPAQTNYLYMTYHADSHDLTTSKKPPIVVIGSGPYCIGSSVEFDWCAVNTVRTLRSLKEKAVLINSNPETVSTDYDESDRLYFEELTLERIADILDFEQTQGVVISVGGQIANNLALPLGEWNYPILGTAVDSIDQAENRERFSTLLNSLHIDQPDWVKAGSLSQAEDFVKRVGFPVLVRPSYVLSGAAMNVIYTAKELYKYLSEALRLSPDHPVVVSQFIQNAKEIEIDGVAQNGKVEIQVISEHIENAGVHSGDATIVLPPQRLYLETIRRVKKITRKICLALKISGPFNIQFIAQNNDIKVIECNLRASRSFPFVSKTVGHNLIEIATKIFLKKYRSEAYQTLELDYVGVKSPQFSYSRLKGANPVAHVEMASTGEVVALGDDLLEAFYASWQATEQKVKGKKILLSITGEQKDKLLPFLKLLENKGWEFYATEGTHIFLSNQGLAALFLYKISEKIEPNVSSAITNQSVDLIINIPSKNSQGNQTDGYQIRRMAIDHHIPLITNLQIAQLFLTCLSQENTTPRVVKSWQDFHGR